MDISKIVITGGPCAGKTTAMNWINNAFSERGYDVLFVPETATELITGGVAPWTCKTNSDYQHCHMKFQLEKEKVFEQAAKVMKKDKVLIVCDRAALDNKVYMDEATFESVCRFVGASEVELRDQYDAVFHLVTAAKGAEERFHPDDASANGAEERITAEACVPHLLFTDKDYETLGSRIKCNPAIKTEADRAALRKALTDGRIRTIATDHAPHQERRCPESHERHADGTVFPACRALPRGRRRA